MKIVCGLFVLLAVLAGSQGKSVQFLPPFLYPQGQSVISPTIVGGFPTTIADHPHHLAILDLTRGGYLCGASAVHIHWALTAAHCVNFDTPPHLVRKLALVKIFCANFETFRSIFGEVRPADSQVA